MVECSLGFLRLAAGSAFAPMLLFALALAFTTLLRLNRVRLPWTALSAVLVSALIAVAAAYLVLPVLFEDAETDIACVAALILRGQAVYPGPADIGRYALLYGPLTYLAHIPFYALFGENLPSFKLLGFLAFLATLTSLFEICRRYAAPRAALIGLGCASVVLFRYIGVAFWGRIDPVILAAVALCTWALVKAPDWLMLAAAALTFAAVPNLKISGVAYLLPVLGWLYMRKGVRFTAAACVLGAALFPLPFLLPQVSWPHYLLVLRAAAEHGLVAAFLLRNLQYSALLLAPVLASRRRWTFDQSVYFALTALGLAVTCVLGSKSGAGSYHLLPFIVPLLHLYFWTRGNVSAAAPRYPFARFALAWILTTLVLSSAHLGSVVRELRGAPAGREIVSEILRAQNDHRGQTLEVGVGADFNDPRERYSYLTTFDGQPYTIAGAAIRDLQFGGVAIPLSTVRYVETCGTRNWLIPRGDVPFSAPNAYYDSIHPAFDTPFRNAFLGHYRKTGSGERFDLWSCR